ncbi:MAG: inorganic diphosphatase [Candidatus Heimdallarchaeota archaeon]|nr:inorganic diphosphatase [Candidatus Heimdallarchaeota archaeon]
MIHNLFKQDHLLILMLLWKNIVPGMKPPQNVYALIECPKGTRNKYEISKNANVILLDRVLHSSVSYPHDYGLIPGTYADDNDPLDILVLISHPTFPMTLVEAKPIGILLMEDEMGLDEKVLAVATHDPIFKEYEDIVQIPHHFLDEIQEFFRTYKNLEEEKYAEVKEWRGRDYAYMVIEKSIENFKKKFGDIATIKPE